MQNLPDGAPASGSAQAPILDMQAPKASFRPACRLRRSLSACPDSDPARPFGLQATLRVRSGGDILFSYHLQGPLARVRFPETSRAHIGQFRDSLWERTCFEAFVESEGQSYHEFNFSPDGNWAHYLFEGYRSTRQAQQDSRIRICTRGSSNNYHLQARCTLAAGLLPMQHGARLGLNAILLLKDHSRQFWALAHRPGAPDFHDCRTWQARLPGPSTQPHQPKDRT